MSRLAMVVMALTVGLLFASGPALAADFVLHGVVADVDGRPVAGAEVGLYRVKNFKRPADFVSSPTTTDGVYSVTLPAGKYWAVAVLRKGAKHFGPLDLGDKHSGEAMEVLVGPDTELKQDFTVMDLREAAKQHQKKNAALLRLSGRILNADGKPVAMSYAVADTGPAFKEMPSYLSAWTDDSGAYLLLLPKGHFFVGAATLFPPANDTKLGHEITLDKDTEGVDLMLSP